MAKRKPDDYDERLLLSKKLMAEAFGISVQAFDKWKVKPVARDGREVLYLLPEVIAFRLERDAKTDNSLDLRQQAARLNKARADHEELKVDLLRNALFPAEKVKEVWTGMILATRAKLLSMPTKLAAQLAAELDPMVTETLLREEMDEACAELAGYDPNQYGAASGSLAGDDEEDRTAPESEG